MIDELSRRREQIVERLDALGFHSARAAQIATLDTRDAKDVELDVDELRVDWRSVAADHGIDREELLTLTQRAISREVDLEGAERVMLGPLGLTAQTSTFDRRHVLQSWCGTLRNGAPIDEIEALAAHTLARAEVVPLESAPADAAMRRNDRRRIDPPNIGCAYTTDELLTLELRLVRNALSRANERTGVTERWLIDHALTSRPTLGDDQRAMVVALTSSGRGVDVVIAPAGTGKTYALEAACEAWARSGYRLVGCAVAARAARQLQEATGMPSTTIAALTHELTQPDQRFAPGSILVVDEAAMAGTRTLAPLLDAAERDRAKVVLVGDHRQLPEIDAGGLVRGLDHHLGAIRLSRNRRQRLAWEQCALASLRIGRTDAAIATYERQNRVAIDSTASARRMRMAADFATSHTRGEDVLMIVTRWRDVHDLNARARRHLTTTGYLGGPTLTIAHRDYQAGDRIMTLRNARNLGVTNGTIGVIDDVDLDARTITIATGIKRAVLPSEYLDAGGIVHAYATTIHKAQGVTVDRALVLASDDLSQERAYTALSRGRIENRLYLVTSQLEHDHRHLQRANAVDSLRRTVQRSERQELAADHGVEVDLP